MNRYLGRASYVVAFTLIVVPLLDATMSVLPLHFGDPRWRYGTIGLLSNALMIPLAGVLIAFATAKTLDHRHAVRAGAVIAWVGAVICVAAFAAFALDALQSQSQIRPDMHLSFMIASGTAGMKLLLGAVTFMLFGIAGFKDLKSGNPASGKRGSLLMRDERNRVSIEQVPARTSGVVDTNRR